MEYGVLGIHWSTGCRLVTRTSDCIKVSSHETREATAGHQGLLVTGSSLADWRLPVRGVLGRGLSSCLFSPFWRKTLWQIGPQYSNFKWNCLFYQRSFANYFMLLKRELCIRVDIQTGKFRILSFSCHEHFFRMKAMSWWTVFFNQSIKYHQIQQTKVQQRLKEMFKERKYM